jgi:hypothetical protein
LVDGASAGQRRGGDIIERWEFATVINSRPLGDPVDSRMLRSQAIYCPQGRQTGRSVAASLLMIDHGIYAGGRSLPLLIIYPGVVRALGFLVFIWVTLLPPLLPASSLT